MYNFSNSYFCLQHPVLQFVGYCNAFDTAMRKCLKAERLTRQKAHNEAALKKNAAIRARIREQEKAENNI